MYSVHKLYDTDINKVLNVIRVADCTSTSVSHEINKILDNEINFKVQNLTVSNVLNCSYCKVSFNDAIEQRTHFKLDWHRYNLKRALHEKQHVSEDIFNNLADDVSSISGSESEFTDKDDADYEKNCNAEGTADGLISHKSTKIRHAKAFFVNSEDIVFSIYRCLICSKNETLSDLLLLSSISSMLSGPKKWMIVMLGGGHFAAAIFNNGVLAEHKTFHCYTVRAKQGGSQSSRDNKGGNHPKSAGASLRRYNEQALLQHVQEIISSWSASLKQCQLILYRAAGPYNRGVLFGGKNPPLEKNDSRLRAIPFPTRRPTFNEVKRVYDILCTVEVYGPASEFKDKFPKSPDKRGSPRHINPKPSEVLSNSKKLGAEHAEAFRKKKPKRQIDRSKPRSSPEREMPGEFIRSVSESSASNTGDDDENNVLVTNYMSLCLDELKEFEDTVPEYVKEAKKEEILKNYKFKSPKKRKKDIKSPFDRQLEEVQRQLLISCQREDLDLLVNTLQLYQSLPEKAEATELNECEVAPAEPHIGCKMTKRDFINCLNSRIEKKSQNTALHLSASKCLPKFVTLLLEAGADPTVTNKNSIPPYVVSGNKETKNAFKNFVSLFPDKFDLKIARIPEPLTGKEKEAYDEKRKERNKLKREKDKLKRKVERDKKEEEEEKARFLALSDTEKCAFAASRLNASDLVNLKSAKSVLSRCFQCGVDITGQVPFEYGTNRFCSVSCVKFHRLKTKSYSVNI